MALQKTSHDGGSRASFSILTGQNPKQNSKPGVPRVFADAPSVPHSHRLKLKGLISTGHNLLAVERVGG